MESRSNDDVNLDQDDSSKREIETDTTATNDNADESLNNTKEEEEEEVIPLMSEELDVNKTELVDEATITKEPIKETKTEQIPIMHEELVIEQRPVNENSQSLPSNNNEEFKLVETNTQIKIPIKREEVEITKKPYVIEELVVKKKAVTKTQTITEEIITETVNDPQV